MTTTFAAIQKGNKQFNLVCDEELTGARTKQIVRFVSTWLDSVGSLFDGPQHTVRVWISAEGFSTSIDADQVTSWA